MIEQLTIWKIVEGACTEDCGQCRYRDLCDQEGYYEIAYPDGGPRDDEVASHAAEIAGDAMRDDQAVGLCLNPV